MRFRWSVPLVLLIMFYSSAWAQPQRPGTSGRPEALQIVELEMLPDPVREGQRVRFNMTIQNRTSHAGRVNFFIKDSDEVVSEARAVVLRPGNNRIEFPDTGYRFSRRDHCFSVEVDIAGNRRPVDFAREFCVYRTYAGWSLSKPAIGPFVVEGFEMVPDPARPRQEVQFRVRLKNLGAPVRANLRIRDRDEVVSRIDHVWMEPGTMEYPFPYTGYTLQRFDHCFSVMVEVEGRPYPAETAREICVRPSGWTLRP